MIAVHTWEPNANSGKPLFCLHEKGVPFAYHYVDMGRREQHGPAFLAINPAGTVPAVVHDGLVMTESTPALEYIDDAFDGPALKPADPLARVRMRQVMRAMDQSICPALAMVASNRLAPPRFRDMGEEERRRELDRIPSPERRRTWELLMFDRTPPAELAESERRVAEGIGWLEALLADGPWLAGDVFSLADVVAVATFHSVHLSRPAEVNADRTPRLIGWLRRCHARPGIRAALAMGSGSIARRAAEARSALGLAEAA